MGASTTNPPTAPGNRIEKAEIHKQVSFSQQYFIKNEKEDKYDEDNDAKLLHSAAFVREE